MSLISDFLKNRLCTNLFVRIQIFNCGQFHSVSRKNLKFAYRQQVCGIPNQRISFVQLSKSQLCFSSFSSSDDIKSILSIPENKLKQLNLINSSDIENVLQDLRKYASVLSEYDLLNLSDLTLKTVSRGVDSKLSLVEKFWIFISSLEDGQISELVLCKFLEICINAHFHIFYEDIEKFMHLHGIGYSQKVVELLLKYFAILGKENEVEKIIKIIDSENLQKNDNIYSSLIRIKGRLSDVDGVSAIRGNMTESTEKWGSDIYHSLIVAYHSCGCLNEAVDVINKITSLGIKFSSKEFEDLVLSFVQAGGFSKCPKHFQLLLDSNLMIEEDAEKKQLILQLLHAGFNKEGFFVLSSNPNCFLEPHVNSNCYWFIENLVKSAKDSSEVVEICSNMVNNNINTNAVALALELSLIHGKVDTAWALLEALNRNEKNLKDHYFWPLFCLLQPEKDQAAQTVQIVSRMVQLDYQPSSETLEKFVIPNLPFETPELVLRMLSKAGVSVGKAVNPLLVVLISRSLLEEATDLIVKSEVSISVDNLVGPLASVYPKFPQKSLEILSILLTKISCNQSKANLKSVAIADRFARILPRGVNERDRDAVLNDLFASFEEFNIPYTSHVRNSFLRNEFSLGEDSTPGRTENHLRSYSRNAELTLEQLEHHLIELKTKGMNTRGVLRKLLIRYSSLQNKQKLKEVLEELKKQEKNMSAGMLSSAFHSCIMKKDANEALVNLCLLEEEFPNFLIDSYKILDLCHLLACQSRIKESFEVMKKYISKTPVDFHNMKSITRNCHRLLSALVERGCYSEAKEMLSLLLNGGLAEPSPIILGPLIKYHLNTDNITNIVKEAEEIYATYHILPMRVEIMIKIVDRLVNSESKDKNVDSEELSNLLDNVLMISKNTRGEKQMKQDLLHATIESGNEEEAQNIFKSVEKDLEVERIKKLCNFLVRHEKSRCLLLLLKISRGSDRVNRIYICESLLNIYYVTREHEAALNLWSTMQTEGLRPSALFMEKISKLLGSATPTSLSKLTTP